MNDHSENKSNSLHQLRELIPYILLLKSSYLAGFFWLVLTNLFALSIPWLLKLAVDSLKNHDVGSGSISRYAMLIIAASLLHGGSRIFSRTTLLHGARKIEYLIREDMYKKVLTLDNSFFDRERTGDIMSRFTNDLTNVRMLSGFGILNIFNTLILYASAFTMLITISSSLSLVAVLPFPLMVFVVKRISRAMFKRSMAVQEELASMTNFVEENVTASQTIRAFNLEKGQADAFHEISGRYLFLNMKVARLRGLMVPVMAAAGALSTLILLLFGGRMVINGELSLGDFVAFSGYLAMLVWPTVVLGWILNLMQRGAASMQRINFILQEKSIFDQKSYSPSIPDMNEGLNLENVSFSFGENLVLDHINVKLKPGESLGITGAVGTGKSTLLKLVAGLYPVSGGKISIGGVEIAELDNSTLNDLIAFVPQESFLFSRTVAENIGYAVDNPQLEAVKKVSELASFDGDAERFTKGYDSLVGERGITLSGGQRQRASIARALLKNAPVLLLDDPLSAVDAETEEKILSNLNRFYQNKIVVAVSHRLSIIKGCTRIICIEGGRIAEEGDHESLLKLGGKYFSIWESQKIRSEIEAA